MRPVSGAERSRADSFGHCLSSESEVSAFCVGTYWFQGTLASLTLASRPASPGTIDPSRNRSPPIELCFGDLSYGLSIATGQIHPECKAGAARLIPGRRRKSAGPFGIRRHLCALLL